ncbi:hypothetical protein M885DRAFT_574529 [Pelagophyceae sp. CCMP2097]|nr:hypothetical protein M885DRAFT_574529 [Pelagophyceae sp. CCMP2097]
MLRASPRAVYLGPICCRPARRFASTWAARLEPRLSRDLAELTGVGADDDVTKLSPSKRAAFHGIRFSVEATRQVTPDMRERWKTVCDGGFQPNRKDLLAQHDSVDAQLKLDGLLRRHGGAQKTVIFTDEVSEANLCDAAVEDLRPISIADLQVDTVHFGRVVWLTLAVSATKFTGVSAISAVVDDDSGASTTLALHNATSPETSRAEVEKQFPAGLRLAVKQPYMRCGMTGARELRIDNPSNLCGAHEPQHPSNLCGAHEPPPRATASGNFVGPVEVALVAHGRGLVAARFVAKGELLLKERALASVKVPSGSRQHSMLAGDGRSLAGSKADLVSALVSGLAGDALLRARIACLYYGEARSDVPAMALFSDGALPGDSPPVSAARAARVIVLNAFGSGDEGQKPASGRETQSRLVNTEREIFGSTMHVVARFDIQAGEEITTDYFTDDGAADPALAHIRRHARAVDTAEHI